MYYMPEFTRTGRFAPAVATVLSEATAGPVRIAHLKAPNARDDPHAGYADPGDVLAWLLVAGGAAVIGTRRGETHSTAGRLTVHHLPRVTRIRMTPDFRALSIRFAPGTLALSPAEIDALAGRPFPLADGTPRLLGLLAAQLVNAGDRYGEASRAALAQSIVDLARGFAGDVAGRRAPEPGARGLVLRARRHIELYIRSVTPAGVAEHLGVSVRALQKAFATEDTTVAETIRQTRLGRARSLLEGADRSRLPIEQVAERAGFRSASTFSRAFSASFGVSPRDWRDGRRELA
jgi:AraC-like DNA-binding protein